MVVDGVEAARDVVLEPDGGTAAIRALDHAVIGDRVVGAERVDGLGSRTASELEDPSIGPDVDRIVAANLNGVLARIDNPIGNIASCYSKWPEVVVVLPTVPILIVEGAPSRKMIAESWPPLTMASVPVVGATFTLT